MGILRLRAVRVCLSGSVMLFIGKKTLLSLYHVPDNMQESGDTAVNKTCNPGPWKALPASGEMIGLQINILKVNANYNYSRCLEIQMQEVLFLL